MEGMDKAREMAQCVQAGERAAMRRWLTRRGLNPETFNSLPDLTASKLEALIKERGGDLERIKAEGRKRVVDRLLREK